MENKAGMFTAIVLLGRDLSHRAHWKTDSYSVHVALQEFYESVLEFIDEFVEKYQGRFGERIDVPLADNEFEGDISDILEQQMAWIEDNRDAIVDRSETALHNVIDEVVGVYQRALYKLRMLA